MQFGITAAKTMKIRIKVSNSLPVNKSRFDVLAVIRTNVGLTSFVFDCGIPVPCLHEDVSHYHSGHVGKALVVEGIRSVAWKVVVRVSEVRGVGPHNGW